MSPLLLKIPSLYLSLIGSEYDWRYYAEKSANYSRALATGTVWPRGKMIGGSSAINAMVYLRGFPGDFEVWNNMGNDRWDYETVQKVYERMENNQAKGGNLGESGPVKLDYYYSPDRVRYVVLDAVKEKGYKFVEDFNDPDSETVGYTFTHGTLTRGIRQSAARAYLIPVADRPNLTVVKFAHVTNLIMAGNRVLGVNFKRGHLDYQALATKEVILAAGAINTPHILMLSGVGPKAHLREHGIPVVQDLAVGQNLQDHVMVAQFFQFSKIHGEVSWDQTLDMVYQYFKNKTGLLAAPASPDFIGFFNTKQVRASHPDMQTQHIVWHQNNPDLLSYLQKRGYKRQFIDQLLAVNKRMTILMVYMILANPESVGHMELRNNDPLYKPKIYPNYFGHAGDLRTMVEGLQVYDDLLDTEAFKEFGGELIHFEGLDCSGDSHDYTADQYWECYARYFSTTLYHPCGTTKMGPSSDPAAVVDQQLRVRGIDNLRVADASIMPRIVSVNTNAVSMMIGERCADFIRETYS